jgi:hypothetical protein
MEVNTNVNPAPASGLRLSRLDGSRRRVAVARHAASSPSHLKSEILCSVWPVCNRGRRRLPRGRKTLARAPPGGSAWTVEGAPWTEPFAGRTVEGGGCAPDFSVRTEQGMLGSLSFFACALERDGTIPSREGCVPAREGRLPQEGPPKLEEVRYLPPRGRRHPSRGWRRTPRGSAENSGGRRLPSRG